MSTPTTPNADGGPGGVRPEGDVGRGKGQGRGESAQRTGGWGAPSRYPAAPLVAAGELVDASARTNGALSQVILSMAGRMGFASAGICSALPASPQTRSRYDRWLASGAGGAADGPLGYLHSQREARFDVAAEQAGCRSIVMVADQYWPRASGESDGQEPARAGFGKVARYARGRDYHASIKQRLHVIADTLRLAFPGHAFRSFADSAPILERDHALSAGLGWIGKHTLLINPKLGSYLLLGGMLTTLELTPTRRASLAGLGEDASLAGPGQADQESREVADHCGTCTRCIDACPTRAITPYSVDATKCISYLTIEHTGEIPAELADKLEGWLFGCDICQEVCPHNSARAWPTPANAEYAARFNGFELETVLGWDEQARRKATEGTAMKRVSLEQLQRTAHALLVGQVKKFTTETRSHGEIEEGLTTEDTEGTEGRRE